MAQEQADQAACGELTCYAALPWFAKNAVADLDRVMTIEKGLLVNLDKLAAWSTDREICNFQRTIVRRYQRFAFPDEFSKGMSKLRKKVASRHGKPNSAEGVLFSRLRQVRVEPDSSWGEATFSCTFHFILPVSTLPKLPEDLTESKPLASARTWFQGKSRNSSEIAEKLLGETDTQAISFLWHRLAETWISQLVEPIGGFLGGSAEVASDEEFSLADMNRTVALDLDYLSDQDA
ncbi:hypothetical protein ACFVYA_00205 [Amycolatopsis sp. NPDC058278]|uniref:hypothetical protein n=1 Tax=Amycolatopsis sp. NPDC058278 TaxID=3346417 RepID=UPI0036D79E1D